ncbi:MAG: sulfur oxidation c-type cytochrome SoxX [Gammaproteobacteria bacterium]
MKTALPCIVLFLTWVITTQANATDGLSEGKNLAFDRAKGNCLACHAIEDGEAPGNIGPALSKLSARFKNKQQLRQQIWDATALNPETSMPPFGRNKILTEAEIDQIVDYLWSFK